MIICLSFNTHLLPSSINWFYLKIIFGNHLGTFTCLALQLAMSLNHCSLDPTDPLFSLCLENCHPSHWESSPSCELFDVNTICSPMVAKTFLRHLVTSQENLQSWKQIYTRLKMMPTKYFSLQTNCHILYFIKAHGVFLHHGVLKINLQVNKHHQLNTSRKTWSTHIVVRQSLTPVETHLKHLNLLKMTSWQTWYTIMLQSWIIHDEPSPGLLLTHT